MSLLTKFLCFAAAPCLFAMGCAGPGNGNESEPPLPTGPAVVAGEAPTSGESFADDYKVKFETSKGDFVVLVHPSWAPRGAARFQELVETKFYDDCRFFRVLDGFMAQVGMNGDPAVNEKWQDNTFPDDPVRESNTKGRVTFATSGPDSRTSQIFFNYGNNASLDSQGFSPFGEVVEGYAVLESLYGGYGEGAPQGNGPSQGQLAAQGNAYLNSSFPKLDYIKTARIVDGDAADSEASPAIEADNADAPTTGEPAAAPNTETSAEPNATEPPQP